MSFCLEPRGPAVINLRVVTASLVAALLISSAADAATVTNRDDRDHSVTIIEGDTDKNHIVKPHAVLEGICQKGCLIRLDDGKDDPYELEGSEVTSIEDGQLYDDEQGSLATPNDGDASPPSQPGSR